ncbi:MAG: ABC transporter substrate-binding protein [Thermomicrobiales bacterium]|nr:ABC transporter substrate-binding protein [Thermomicrobiales bacterium]
MAGTRDDTQPPRPAAAGTGAPKVRLLTRRSLLASLGGMAAVTLLASCGGASPTATTTTSSSSTTKAATSSSTSSATSSSTTSAAGGAASSTTASASAASTSKASTGTPAASGSSSATTSAAASTTTAAQNPFGEPKKKGSTYIIGLGDQTGLPRDFVGTSYYGTTAFFISKLLYTPLIQLDSNWTNPGPGLATDWQWSSDKKQLTLHLRKDVKFHDGSAFTAKDVDFTYKLMVRNDPYPAVQDLTIFEGADEYKKGTTDDFKGLTVVDDYTIRFNLTSPSSVFELNISNCGIVPAKAFGADALTAGGDIAKLPFFDGKAIGTGPFKIKSYDSKAALTLEAHNDFFRGAPALGSIIFRFNLAGPAGVAALQSGEIDAELIGAKDAASLRDVQSLDLKTNYALANETVLINATEKDYLNEKVLQGLITAIDVDTLIKTVGYNFPKPAPSIMMHPTLFPNPDLPVYKYDVAKAKSLLQEGKWDSSRKLQLGQWLQQGLPNDMATAIITMWKAVGVNAEFLLMDPANQVKMSKETPHQYDVALTSFAWLAYDPSSAYASFACERRPDYSSFCNADFDSAMKSAIRAGTLNDAKPFFQKAQTVLGTYLPYTPVWMDPEIFAISKKMHGGVLGRGPLNNVQPELWWKE